MNVNRVRSLEKELKLSPYDCSKATHIQNGKTQKSVSLTELQQSKSSKNDFDKFSLNQISDILDTIDKSDIKKSNTQKCKRCSKNQEYKSYWDNHQYRVLCHECREYNKKYLKLYSIKIKTLKWNANKS